MSQDRKNKRAAQAAAREGAGVGPTPAEAAAAMAGSPPNPSRVLGSGLARSLKQSSEPSSLPKAVPFLIGPGGAEPTPPSTGLGPTPPLPGPAFDVSWLVDRAAAVLRGKLKGFVWCTVFRSTRSIIRMTS